MHINKRNIDKNIYKLLEDNFINNFEGIVRHYKIISNTNYELNAENILSQKTDDDTFFINGDLVENEYLNNLIYFDNYLETTDDVLNRILLEQQSAYNSYRDTILNKDFTTNERSSLNSYISAYTNHAKDNLYIRFGIRPNEKYNYLIKLFEVYITDYFNELSENNQIELLDNSLLPMFNDTIIYSNKKYEYVKNKENNIIND